MRFKAMSLIKRQFWPYKEKLCGKYEYKFIMISFKIHFVHTT